MLAARNRRFRLAAIIGALAYLIIAVGEALEANQLLGAPGVPGGYQVGAAILPVAEAVGACGWVVIAAGLDAEIDWARLRRGGALVGAALAGLFVAVAVETVTVLDHRYPEGTKIDLY